MNTPLFGYRKLVIAMAATLVMAACATSPATPEGAVSAREKLNLLQANSQLASLAPIEIKDADLAVRAAEHPEHDQQLSEHLVMLANRKVDTATFWAQSRLYVDQREALKLASEKARLDARTREADTARRETVLANQNAIASRTQADIARSEAQIARNNATAARSDAAEAYNDAAVARQDTAAAQLETEALQREITELNARETDRGLVVTLGDVLFATGKSAIVGSNDSNLGKLAVFLNQYPDRMVEIEGHTDNVGSDSANMGLSQRRADAVKTYLMGEGIAENRVTAAGKGENSPVSSNDTDTGRQQNRRVEVIITNSATTIPLQ